MYWILKSTILAATVGSLALLGFDRAWCQAPKVKDKAGPNLVIDASGRLFNAVLKQDIDRTEEVQDTILEVPVRGLSRMKASVWSELVPDGRHGVLDVVFKGTAYSRTVGTRPFVLIYSSTETPIEVRRRVVMDAKGIRVFEGQSYADPMTQLDKVMSRAEPDLIAMRFAERGFEKSKGHAEHEAGCKAVEAVSRRMAEEMAIPLSKASKSIGAGLKALKNAGIGLESLEFATSQAALSAHLRLATPGVPAPPPPDLPEGIDIGVRIHQSVFNEAARALFGGKSIRLSEVSDFYNDVTLGLLQDARKDDQKIGLKRLQELLADLGGKTVFVTLDAKSPLNVVFTEQGFTIDILVHSIKENGEEYAGMRVRTSYRFENGKDGAYVVRKEPVRYLPLDPQSNGKKLRPQPASFLVVREVLFAEVLKERLLFSMAPALDALPRVRLQPPRAGARAGWVAAGWTITP